MYQTCDQKQNLLCRLSCGNCSPFFLVFFFDSCPSARLQLDSQININPSQHSDSMEIVRIWRQTMNDKEELAQSSPEINPVLIMKFEKKDEFNAHFWKLGHFILQVRNNLMTLLIICTLFSNLLRLSVNTYRISNSTPNSAQSSKVLTHTNSLLSPLHAYTVSHSHYFFLVRWLSCFVFISPTRHPQRSPPTQCEITSQFSQNRKKKQILRIRKKRRWSCSDDLVSRLNVPETPGFVL